MTGLEGEDPRLFEVATRADGPAGSLPLTEEMLLHWPSGHLFGLSQNVGMGWPAAAAAGRQALILSTQGGLRHPDGRPRALGFHTGHWEVGLLVEEIADALAAAGMVPFAAAVSDPCDGRTQGTTGMMDSLPYRNDAATVLRRLVRSLPRREAVLGVATCDKGLPAMLMALAACRDLPTVAVPGGVTLPPTSGEDAGAVQTLGARYAHGKVTLAEAAELGCRACASPGGGCQFLGTAATAQAVAEALGLTVPHAALAPSGQPVWRDVARRSAAAAVGMLHRGIRTRDVLTEAALANAMTVHAAIGGSTNLLLHIPAIAHQAGLRRPTVEDWQRVNRAVPRLVDALPNGPRHHPTVQVYLAGGVPEVMLHLRDAGLLALDALTVNGATVGQNLAAWEASPRRAALKARLAAADGIDAADVIMPPDRARSRGLTSTVLFPRGNLAPDGSVVKATAIDPALVDADGTYRHCGPARVFLTEADAIAAVKAGLDGPLRPGDVLALICRGPMGSGMEETYQVTAALKHLAFGRHIPLVTDARFSGVSTGACIGHVGPEALAGGPIGKLRDGDLVRLEIDRVRLAGSIDLVGTDGAEQGRDWGTAELARRSPRPDLAPDPALPDDTRLWALLQSLSGGTWGGCVHDADALAAALGGESPRNESAPGA